MKDEDEKKYRGVIRLTRWSIIKNVKLATRYLCKCTKNIEAKSGGTASYFGVFFFGVAVTYFVLGFLPPHPVERYLLDSYEASPVTVKTVHTSDMNTTFFWSHTSSSTPLLIIDAAEASPARSCWTDAYLARALEAESVELEESTDGRFANWLDGWDSRKRKFSSFLRSYWNPENRGHVYIAEYDLTERLAEDITQPHFTSFMSPERTLLWLGTDSESLPHTDFNENVLMVLDGCKTIRLVDPLQRYALYTSGWEWLLGNPPNYSPVNFFEPDFVRFPRFQSAYVSEVRLCAGDALYIPAFWFHHVRSAPSKKGQTSRVINNVLPGDDKNEQRVDVPSRNDTMEDCAFELPSEGAQWWSNGGGKNMRRTFGDRCLAVNFWFPTHSEILDMVFGCMEASLC